MFVNIDLPIFQPIVAAVGDPFYKITSEALLVTQNLVKVIRPLGKFMLSSILHISIVHKKQVGNLLYSFFISEILKNTGKSTGILQKNVHVLHGLHTKVYVVVYNV